MATPPSLAVIEQSERYQLADEFHGCVQNIERFIFINNNAQNGQLIDFTEKKIPLLIFNLTAVKSSIKRGISQLSDETMREEMRRYIEFEHSEALKFKAKHDEMMNMIKRDALDANDPQQSTRECVSGLLDLYNRHIDMFRRKLSEINSDLSSNDHEQHDDDTIGSTTSKLLNWGLRIIIFIVVLMLITVYLPIFNSHIVAYLETQNLDWCLPILLSLVLGCWLSITPGGSMPSIMCGIIFHDNPWLAVTVSYVSTNMGALFNLAWIRLLLIKNERRCCVKAVMSLFGINRFRRSLVLKRLFKIWNPISIIVILRLPFVGGGTINYLSAFQPELISVRQCIIANAIGYLPGSVLFPLFGNTIEKHIKTFLITIWNCETWEKRLITIQEWQIGIFVFILILTVVITMYALLFRYTQRILKESERRQSNSKSVML